MELPAAGHDQAFVSVSVINGGGLSVPERYFVSPADEQVKRCSPTLVFLITHPAVTSAGQPPHRILFDLGMRVRKEDYTPQQQAELETGQPSIHEPGVLATLSSHGIHAEDVGTILLSHAHWDHTGDPAHFPTSKFVVGSGTLDLLKNGLSGKHAHTPFDSNLLPLDRASELPPVAESNKWVSLGEFQALDFLGDGSVYVLDAPGHLPGHINLLCRTGPTTWVCLAADSYHDVRLRTGQCQIATWPGPSDSNGEASTLCAHYDKEGAERHIGKLRHLAERGDVEIIAAHEIEWLENNGHRLFPNAL